MREPRRRSMRKLISFSSSDANTFRRDGEREADVHPGAVALDRRVEELFDAGEIDDGVELPADLLAAHPQDRAVEIDVLPAGQLGVKAGADLEQRSDAAEHVDGAL